MTQEYLSCQRCSLAIKLHPTISNLSKDPLQDLIGKSLNLESFQDLTQTEPRVKSDEIRQIDAAAKLFDILSGHSDIDHPLCQECAHFILDQMDDQLVQLEKECKESQTFYKQQSTKTTSATKFDIDYLTNELDRLEKLEKHLTVELKSLKETQKEVDARSKDISEKKKILEERNQTNWTEYNRLKHQLFNLDDELVSAENQIAYYKLRKEKLSKLNVLNSTFHIWHNGNFATINGFRLGRLPKEQVSWDEINAAWGQCVLLLHCLAKKIGLKFRHYKLVPYGNNSSIESLDNKSRELPLYVSGGFRFIWPTKYDQAMIAFLDCLQQFKEHVEKNGTNFKLPYRMEKGNIIETAGGYSYSIKIQTNSEEQWTKALKFMLTNLKWSLAYVTSIHSYD